VVAVVVDIDYYSEVEYMLYDVVETFANINYQKLDLVVGGGGKEVAVVVVDIDYYYFEVVEMAYMLNDVVETFANICHRNFYLVVRIVVVVAVEEEMALDLVHNFVREH
jgi:hypothetical protein